MYFEQNLSAGFSKPANSLSKVLRHVFTLFNLQGTHTAERSFVRLILSQLFTFVKNFFQSFFKLSSCFPVNFSLFVVLAVRRNSFILPRRNSFVKNFFQSFSEFLLAAFIGTAVPQALAYNIRPGTICQQLFSFFRQFFIFAFMRLSKSRS